MSVIECKDVSIRYITGDFKSIGLKEYIIRRIKHNYKINEFWADKGISFSLEKGDMLGIVGANGAGKSTLLKAVTGIMVPTYGNVMVKGTIAALLELGSGFDEDLTVRENTYLRGALLGYTRKFMDEKYKDIISFAELEDFQDYYFKQLSSGMKSRLAFSIACLVDPDVLILDEVLSVGDGAFQEKSARRMREVLNAGVTGILVSHSIQQIREVCNKVLWLDHGIQVAFGSASEVCNAYQLFLDTPKEQQHLPSNEDEIRTMSESFKVLKYMDEKESEKIRDNLDKGIDQTAILGIRRTESIAEHNLRLMEEISRMSEEEKREMAEHLKVTQSID